MRDKLEGGILGLAVGDALGVPVEFNKREKLENNPISEMVGFGSHNMPPGTWSDDTSLALAAFDSIRECGTINYDDIMNKFVEWYANHKYTATGVFFDIGIATSKAIKNYLNGKVPTACGCTGEFENGNGSLMRILPFVYFLKANNLKEEEETKFINDASSLTHAHDISKLGCKIYSDYVSLLLDGVDKIEALDVVRNIDYSKYYSKDAISKYSRLFSDNFKDLPKDEISSTGYVVHSLEASIWCTLNSDSYEEAVKMAVNLGDDTDTVGAITGSINGIIYGEQNIPKRWVTKLNGREELENIAYECLDVLGFKKKVNTFNAI